MPKKTDAAVVTKAEATSNTAAVMVVLAKEVGTFHKFVPAKIEDTHDQEVYAEWRTRMKEFVAAAEATRVQLTKPLNDHVTWINKQFKELAGPVTTKLNETNLALSNYQDELEKERAREYAARVIEEAKNESPIPESVAPIPESVSRQVKTGSGVSMGFRTDWVWEEEDIRIVPRKYLMLDTAAIGKAVRGGERNIKGIRIYSKQTPVDSRR